MDEKKVFMDCLRKEFAPKLRDAGFKGSGQNFRRVTGEMINCINIQGNKYGGSCTVNLGLHLTFLPVNWADHSPDLKKVKEIECEFRKRLAPGGKADYWWKYKGLFSSPAKNVRHLVDTYFRHGEPCFRRYASVQDVAAMVSLDEVRAGKYLNVFGGMTIQRAALTMARINRHLGNTTIARQFAEVGLTNIGSASALKSCFEELLEATTGKELPDDVKKESMTSD